MCANAASGAQAPAQTARLRNRLPGQDAYLLLGVRPSSVSGEIQSAAALRFVDDDRRSEAKSRHQQHTIPPETYLGDANDSGKQACN